MPTTTPPSQRPSGPETHQHRQAAESFGTDPERYDRVRPRYPDALVDRIVAGSSGSDVLDVGCGTGIVARQFQEAGLTVLGVEPDARMADFARQTGVKVEVTTFEAWDPAGRQFDAITAGQSWHWVDPVAGAAKAATALRPTGTLTLFWHVFATPPEVANAFTAAYQRVVSDPPDSPTTIMVTQQTLDTYDAILAKAEDGIRQADGFGTPERWRFDWEHTYSRAEWLDLLPTISGLTELPAGELAEVLGEVGSAIDAIGGSFVLPYKTLALTAIRTANAE